jgi:hypothetical protein
MVASTRPCNTTRPCGQRRTNVCRWVTARPHPAPDGAQECSPPRQRRDPFATQYRKPRRGVRPKSRKRASWPSAPTGLRSTLVMSIIPWLAPWLHSSAPFGAGDPYVAYAFSLKIISTSTLDPCGSPAMPMAVRTPMPASSPRTAMSSSDAPLMTRCWFGKPASLFT